MLYFKKNAKSRAITYILVGSGAGSCLFLFEVLRASAIHMAFIVVLIAWFVGVSTCVAFCWQGVSLFRSGGKWEIIINEKGVIWSSPNQKVDQSFSLVLSDIAKLQIREEYKKGSEMNSKEYVLFLQSGQEILLSSNSGISLASVSEAFRSVGVPVEISNS